MSVIKKGVALLGFGTHQVTALVVQAVARGTTSGLEEIANEVGDWVATAIGFEERTEITLECVPADGAVKPEVGDVITVDSHTAGAGMKFQLQNFDDNEVNNASVRWTLSGILHPEITL